MAWTDDLEFTDGSTLTAANLNKIVENTEDNRLYLEGTARGYAKSSSAYTSTSLSYGSSPVLSVTKTFHGRPVILMYGGSFYGDNSSSKIPRGFKLGYQIDATTKTDGIIVANTIHFAYRVAMSWVMLPTVSAGSHTIKAYCASYGQSGHNVVWVNPAMLVWELPFDDISA